MDNSFKKLLSDMWPIFHKTTLFLSEKKKTDEKNLQNERKKNLNMKVSKIYGGV